MRNLQRKKQTAGVLAKTEQFFLRHQKAIGLGLCIFVFFIGMCFVLLSQEQYDYQTPLNQEEIAQALQRNGELPYERQVVVDAAVSLVGKVHYFWGGKSSAMGFDPQWGVMREVTSKGSQTTGSVRPFGLDCSGYVSWAFMQLGMDFSQMEMQIGNGTANQWEKSMEISFSDLQPGDLLFQYPPGHEEGNHVGICIGKTKWGEPLIAHCAAGFDNVVVTVKGNIFAHARRPFFYGGVQLVQGGKKAA